MTCPTAQRPRLVHHEHRFSDPWCLRCNLPAGSCPCGCPSCRETMGSQGVVSGVMNQRKRKSLLVRGRCWCGYEVRLWDPVPNPPLIKIDGIPYVLMTYPCPECGESVPLLEWLSSVIYARYLELVLAS